VPAAHRARPLFTKPPENDRHAVDELVMVFEGEVEFEIDEEVLRPSIGEELLIPAGVRLYGYKTAR